MKLSSSFQLIYRCRLVNYGNSPIFNVDVPLHITFMEAISDGTNPGSTRSGDTTSVRKWPIAIPEIGGTGGMFVFYISDRSSKFTFVTLPEFVTFERANMETKNTARLRQPSNFKLTFSPVMTQ